MNQADNLRSWVVWCEGASRVWLHTNSLDHPYALANYQARGLRVYKTEQERG